MPSFLYVVRTSAFTYPEGRNTLNTHRHLRLPVLLAGLAAVLLASGCAGPFAMRGKAPLNLVWYGLARQGTFQRPTYVQLGDSLELATGDGVALFLTVEPDAYVYVLHQTVSGEFALWWPMKDQEFDASAESGRILTLPSRGRVYTMDFARGVESIYIIASREPIKSVNQLTREMRALFTIAQAMAVGIPADRIEDSVPNDMLWDLNPKKPTPVTLVDQYVPVAASVKAVGDLRLGSEQVVTTAEGGHYTVRAERLAGKDVVARVIRLKRIISHGDAH